MERYLILLKSYKRMPPELEQILQENVHPLTVRKHEIIQPFGTVTDYLYFVEKGLFRLFVDRHGTPATLRFKKEDEFIISLKRLFPEGKDPGMGIEALEDGLLWLFPGSLVWDLVARFPQFTIQFTTILTKDLIRIDEGIDYAESEEATDNYDRLRQLSPELLDRVPIPYLADYTNIPENVLRHLRASKIRLNVSTTRRRKH